MWIMEPLCLSVMIMVESRRPPNPSFSKALSVINRSCAAFISQQWRGCWLECFSKGARNVLVAFNVVPDPHVRSQAAFNQKLIEGENLLKSKLLVLKRHYIHHLTLHCIASCVNVYIYPCTLWAEVHLSSRLAQKSEPSRPLNFNVWIFA